MQVVNMDVVHHDSQGQPTDGRNHFGPLSPGLNAIYGPEGSGKSRLLAWLRQIAAGDRAIANATTAAYPQTHFDPLAISTADDPFVSEPSQTRARRLALSGSLEFENRGRRHRVRSDQRGSLQSEFVDPVGEGSELTSRQRAAFVSLTDPATAESDAALYALGEKLTVHQSASRIPQSNHQVLLDRKRDLESRLDRMHVLHATRDSLVSRRSALQAELMQAEQHQNNRLQKPEPHVSERYASIESELQESLAQIDEIDQQLAALRTKLQTTDSSSIVEIDSSYRERLQKIDDRLNRWRQTLSDLKVHREHLDHQATDARLDRQVGDQLSVTKQADPRAALRSLESQISSARKQLDMLVERFSILGNSIEPASLQSDQSALHSQPYSVHHDANGQTRIAYRQVDGLLPDSSNLPQTLRDMQRELHQACQQLSRHESSAASETLKAQSQQLQRCESELLQSIEKLIGERATLLGKIADKYQMSREQLSLAFGDWCDCQQHPHLHDWLVQDQQAANRVEPAPANRRSLIVQIEDYEGRRKSAILQAENCRRQLRDVETERIHRHQHAVRPQMGRSTADVQRELDAVESELISLDCRQRLQTELDDVRRQLEQLPDSVTTQNYNFQATVDRHIAGLMRGIKNLNSNPVAGVQRRYDPIDGIVYDNVSLESDLRADTIVPSVLVRVAIKLAIVESLAHQGNPVPLVLNRSLDPLSHTLQESAISYLGQIARGLRPENGSAATAGPRNPRVQSQQILVLTADPHVAELVRRLHGWVAAIHRQTQTSAVVPDVNRHLAALANDYEADKWYQPSVRPGSNRGTVRGQFYLHERSLIEDCPSIAATAANRLRALGIDRVGDLLDVDPHWLAENVRLDGINRSMISRWQAEARLLCSVGQLRPFDARLLVGVGIRNPGQLAEMHPSELLERVEQFVSTDRGRRILRSGSRYELERITTWIASAKSRASRYQRSSLSDDASPRYDNASSYGYENHKYAGEWGDGQNDYLANRNAGYQQESGEDTRRRSRRSSASSQRRSDRERSRRSSDEGSSAYPVVGRRESASATASDRAARRAKKKQLRKRRQNESLKLAQRPSEQDDSPRLKFYLEIASPVVDAPSIGPRMATRLERIGILTVDQLLGADAESVAEKLNLRRVSAETVRAWQEQARLVCRIPNLRGHDAQLLVASNLTSPEELAAMEPSKVLAEVLVIAESSEGQRILRGGQLPDLAEVTDWISWAANCRTLNAA